MIASYHTHTVRCHHASGADEEYVKSAIDRGIKVLGFSDHAPMIFPNGFICDYKMLPEELSEYCDSVISLREKYKGQIDIRLGLESEYYSRDWLWHCLEFWRDYPIEYLIFGQHYTGPEYIMPRDPTPAPCDDKERLTRYTDLAIEAVESGAFLYMAHPDILNYSGDDEEFYRSEARRLITAIKNQNMPLEYNLLGKKLNRNYPKEIFWQEAAVIKPKVILGCDSHAPERVADPHEVLAATEYISSLGLEIVDRLEIVRKI